MSSARCHPPVRHGAICGVAFMRWCDGAMARWRAGRQGARAHDGSFRVRPAPADQCQYRVSTQAVPTLRGQRRRAGSLARKRTRQGGRAGLQSRAGIRVLPRPSGYCPAEHAGRAVRGLYLSPLQAAASRNTSLVDRAGCAREHHAGVTARVQVHDGRRPAHVPRPLPGEARNAPSALDH
jgi:hypothetical protein